MNPDNIPHNGLPQDVLSIPIGQIIILTNPQEGTTAKHITMIEAIISLANKCGQEHIINTRSVETPGLWDCFVCKVKGDEVLVSDKSSLFEMLCEFWGVDYKEACKTIVLDGRAKFIPYGGEEHPVRVPVSAARRTAKEDTDDNSTRFQWLTVHTKEKQLELIEDVLEDSFIHDIEITFTDIVSLLERVKARERKTYQLKIDIINGKRESWDVNRTVYGLKRECKFILIDPAGNQHSFTLGAQPTALYLTFILFKEGKRLADLKTDDEFCNVFKHICERLKSINSIPDKNTF